MLHIDRKGVRFYLWSAHQYQLEQIFLILCRALWKSVAQFWWQGSGGLLTSRLVKFGTFRERGVRSPPTLYCGHGLFMFCYWYLKTKKTQNRSFWSNFWSVKKGTETIWKHWRETCKVSLHLRKSGERNPVIPIILEVQHCSCIGIGVG